MNITESIDRAITNANAAATEWRHYLSVSGDTNPDRTTKATDALLAFVEIARTAEAEISGRIAERKRLFDAEPILQAVIEWNGLQRKIVVAKPNAQCDDPFIPQTFYEAIRAKWSMPNGEKITTTEKYSIAVIDRYGKIITTINPKI